MDKSKNADSPVDKNPQDNLATEEVQNMNKKTNVLNDISRKDFFDFMRTAYLVYECVEGNVEIPNNPKIDWDELEKNPVIKLLMENMPTTSDDFLSRRGSEGGVGIDGVEGSATSSLENKEQTHLIKTKKGDFRRNSVSGFSRKVFSNKKDANIDPEDSFIETALKSKLSDVLNEGILDSVLPYMVGHSKSNKSFSNHQPIIKKNSATSSINDIKKCTTFSGLLNDQKIKEKTNFSSRIGRRKSSTNNEKYFSKPEAEVEIHVCDEVKGLKKDFKCPQKLLVSKMGYFADVTSGQKLEDMDISVHCDIQIFDWLMRWVKKDSILVSDWPQLSPTNVVPILVSASFLQMDPLLHDCLMYCHTNMTDIVKTNTNLACLNDSILSRLGAMYTNSEMESIKDRKDKIQSRLFCKMIMSFAEPVPETLRGHYISLATLYKCAKCNKHLPKQVADHVPCVPSSMTIDRLGNIISSHTRDLSWDLNLYITNLHGELKTWRKVYWRLWGETHFLKCSICENWFPIYQMEWCCYHADMPQYFSLEPTRSTCLPIGRYPCCGERAFRFQVLSNSTQGCQFREHCPEQKTDYDVSILAIYSEFRDVIYIEPPRMIFPERLPRMVTKGDTDDNGKTAKEIFWWDGLKLAPSRHPLGLLGKLYSGATIPKNQVYNKFQQGEQSSASDNGTKNIAINQFSSASNAVSGTQNNSPNNITTPHIETENKTESKITMPSISPIANKEQKNTDARETSSSDSGDAEESDTSSPESSHSEESSPPHSPIHRRGVVRRRPRFLTRRRFGMGGRQWAAALSARSNQDQQRQYEERAARQMRLLLARRAAVPQSRITQPMGGIYVRLETEWKESNLPPTINAQRPSRHLYSAKAMRTKALK